ncbi:unnamed protein product, partial [Pylaiella littoralis]
EQKEQEFPTRGDEITIDGVVTGVSAVEVGAMAQDSPLTARNDTRRRDPAPQCGDCGKARDDRDSLIMASLGLLHQKMDTGFANLAAKQNKLEKDFERFRCSSPYRPTAYTGTGGGGGHNERSTGSVDNLATPPATEGE